MKRPSGVFFMDGCRLHISNSTSTAYLEPTNFQMASNKNIKKSPAHRPVQTKVAEPIQASTPTKSYWLWGVILIAILALITYWNTSQHGFVLDDVQIIEQNKVTQTGISAENLKTIFTTSHRYGMQGDEEHTLYRPMTKSFFAFFWQWGEGNPQTFHRGNIFLFALTAVMLFVVMFRFFKQQFLPAFAVALLFVVHPIHTEVVANAKSLDEILGMLGILISIWGFQRYYEKRQIIWFPIALMGFLFALFSKESAVVGIALTPMMLYFGSSDFKLKQSIVIVASMTLLFGIFYIARENAIGWYLKTYQNDPSILDNIISMTKKDPSKAGGSYDLNLLLPTVVYLMGYYVFKLFFPFVLSSDYSYSVVQVKTWTDWEFILSLILLIALIVLLVRQFKSKHPMSAGIWWFMIAYSIVSNLFITIGVSFAERLMFLPSAGWCLAIVGIALYFSKNNMNESKESGWMNMLKSQPILLGMTLIFALPFMIKSIQRNKDWINLETLVKKDLSEFPNSTHLNFYWGNYLSGSEYAEGKTPQQIIPALQEALVAFRKSLAIHPDLPAEGFNSLGKTFSEIKRLAPGTPNTYTDSALFYYKKAYEKNPKNAAFVNNIGTIYSELGRIQSNRSYLDSAYRYFFIAYQSDTTSPVFKGNIGVVFRSMGDRPNALNWLYRSYYSDTLAISASWTCKMIEGTYREMSNVQEAERWALKAQQTEQLRQSRR
jgi:tetratricopeptide (TPR) repeat protein